jgi:hypothetical protein
MSTQGLGTTVDVIRQEMNVRHWRRQSNFNAPSITLVRRRGNWQEAMSQGHDLRPQGFLERGGRDKSADTLMAFQHLRGQTYFLPDCRSSGYLRERICSCKEAQK